MSKMYGCVPSSLLNIDDEYTSFCVNEACAYIRYMVEVEKQEPTIIRETGKHKSFSDVYQKFDE